MLGSSILDIEDLAKLGDGNDESAPRPCPYFVAREMQREASIVFMPYNYLLDPKIRETTDVNWHNAIVIFDEAHNVESVAEDAASFDLGAAMLADCIGEAQQCVEAALIQTQDDHANTYRTLKALLMQLEEKIAELASLPGFTHDRGTTRPGSFLFELLASVGITSETYEALVDTVNDANELLASASSSDAGGDGDDADALTSTGRTDRQRGKRGASGSRAGPSASKLTSLSDMISLAFTTLKNGTTHFYKVHVHIPRAKDGSGGNSWLRRKNNGGQNTIQLPTLSYWCFSPGLAMEAIAALGVRSIILTSGTLSPLPALAAELRLQFSVTLENSHVVSARQVWAGVVPVGPKGTRLNSSYQNRDRAEYKRDLGMAIANFAHMVPDGLLVFFPSYTVMNSCIDFWQRENTWNRLAQKKTLVVEPRATADFPGAVDEFKLALARHNTSGAVFFGVCRGKISEGLDFADRAGRAVIITGIPFAAVGEPRVELKKQYLDRDAKLAGVSGDTWYKLQAYRAVNQAVGRVIRHKDDFGAIILLDERFSNSHTKLSKWMQPHIKNYDRFGIAIKEICAFFRDMRTRDARQRAFGMQNRTLHIANERIGDDAPLGVGGNAKVSAVADRKTCPPKSAISADALIKDLGMADIRMKIPTDTSTVARTTAGGGGTGGVVSASTAAAAAGDDGRLLNILGRGQGTGVENMDPKVAVVVDAGAKAGPARAAGDKKLSQMILKSRAALTRTVPPANEIARKSAGAAASVAHRTAVAAAAVRPKSDDTAATSKHSEQPKKTGTKRSKAFVASARDHLDADQYNALHTMLKEFSVDKDEKKMIGSISVLLQGSELSGLRKQFASMLSRENREMFIASHLEGERSKALAANDTAAEDVPATAKRARTGEENACGDDDMNLHHGIVVTDHITISATMERPLTQNHDVREAKVEAARAAAITEMKGETAPRPKVDIIESPGPIASPNVCCFCGSAPDVPHISQCRHAVGCYACWMASGGVCPECGAPAPKNSLKKLFFE